jgi:hypothetical protein
VVPWYKSQKFFSGEYFSHGSTKDRHLFAVRKVVSQSLGHFLFLLLSKIKDCYPMASRKDVSQSMGVGAGYGACRANKSGCETNTSRHGFFLWGHSLCL